MATSYPGALDTSVELPNPSASDKTNSPTHAGLHSNENGAIIAVETKVGTGSSVAASNTLLRGTGAGTSSWSGLTSAQLASIVSDETGSGVLVFGTTPTLITPKVDTINENTPANGVTIDGLSIKDSALNTNNSVITANITNAAVTPDKLSSAAKVATVATSEATSSTSFTDLATTSDTVTATIGANGLALVILTSRLLNNTINALSLVSFAASGANTIAAADTNAILFTSSTANAAVTASWSKLLTGLAAGATTFKMKYRCGSNTSTFQDRSITVIPL